MEFPKDRCAFCENTTLNAPAVTADYLHSLRAKDIHLNLVLDVDNVLTSNYDAFVPLFEIGSTTLFFGIRKGKYCGIADSLGSDLLGINFTAIIPPFMTDKQIFVLHHKDLGWGAIDLEDPDHPNLIVPYGTYKYMWGYDSDHCLVSAKGVGRPGSFEGRGIINTLGKVVVGFKEYKDIWTFYNNRSGLIKVETFNGREIHLLKKNPLHKSVNGFIHVAKSDYADEPIYGSRFGEYAGTYAQDVAGLSDEIIDDAFDGDPDAYWNID